MSKVADYGLIILTFPTKFSYMKGIIGDLGEMKIPLNLDAKPVKQQPYRMNLRYKEKVKIEL